MTTIYEQKGFPNPRRVRMFLAEKNLTASVAFEQVDVMAGEHRTDAFRAINPSGQVPALKLTDGKCISECMAISRYFEALQPSPSMMGTDPEKQAEVEMWQRRAEHGLMDAAGTYFHHATKGLGEPERYRNREWGTRARDTILATMKTLDAQLADNVFITGSDFSVADITAYCGVDFAAMSDIQIPSEFVNLKRWYADVSARPSAKV